jgi:hypothetical protein
MENQEKKQFKLGQIWRFTPPNAPSPLDLLLEIHGLKPLHYYTVEYVNNKGEAKFFGVDGYFTNSFFELYSEASIEPLLNSSEWWAEKIKEASKNSILSDEECDSIIQKTIKQKLTQIHFIEAGIFRDRLWFFKPHQNSDPALKKQSLSEEFDHYKKDSEIAHKMMMSVVEKLQAQIEEKDAKIKNLVSIIDNIKEILE